MDLLLKKNKVDTERLKTFLLNTAAHEITHLSDPCYKPEMSKYYYELLRFTSVTELEIKAFTKKYFEGIPLSHYRPVIEPKTIIIFYIMQYFLHTVKDRHAFQAALFLLGIRSQATIYSKMFPSHCNPMFYKYAIEHLSKNHLYSVNETVGNAVRYLCLETAQKWMDPIIHDDRKQIVSFILELRHRIAQSYKSLAELYYKSYEEGKGYGTPFETEEGVEVHKDVQTSKVVLDAVKKIAIYRIIDSKALSASKEITKVSKDFSDVVIHHLSNVKHSENIRIILDLYVKSIKEVKEICGKNFFDSVKSLMATKRSNSHIYFKQQIELLLNTLLDDSKLKSKFESQTNQTQYLSKLFLAYYLTLVLRNSLC